MTSKPTSPTFLYSDNDPNWEPIALATQSSLNKLGINVKLEKLANATMRDRVGKGDYDIAIDWQLESGFCRPVYVYELLV